MSQMNNKKSDQVTSWASNIKNILCKAGLRKIWENQKWDSNRINIEKCVQNFFMNQYDNCLINQMKSYPKLRTYSILFNGNKLQPYLQEDIPNNLSNYISSLRLGSHKLFIETGRHSKIKADQRICKLCNEGIEDETHFFIDCKVYSNERQSFLNRIINLIPDDLFLTLENKNIHNTEKMAKLLNFHNKSMILEICHFLKQIWIIRNSKI